MERYSFSNLRLADDCLAQWWARRERHIPEPPSDPADAGKYFHSFAEAYRNHLHEKQLDEDRGVIPAMVEKVFSTDKDVEHTGVYRDVYFMALAYGKNYRHNFETYMGSEMYMERALTGPDFESAVIFGYPDMVSRSEDAEGEFIDLEDIKTAWNPTKKSEFIFQGETYGWMAEPTFPDMRIGYSVNFVRHNQKTDTIFIGEIDKPRIEGRMRAIIERIRAAKRSKKFPPRVGAHCHWCPISVQCAKRNVLVHNDVIVADEDSAKTAFEQFLILDAAGSKRQDQLKKYADDHGPVQMNGQQIGFITKEGGPKIEDVDALIERLGRIEAVRNGLLGTPDDEVDSLDIQTAQSIRTWGLDEALRMKLLSVAGNVTKTKKVQADERLLALWITKPSTRFTVADVEKAAIDVPPRDFAEEGAE